MKVRITTKGIDIGDAFKTHITEHLTEMVNKYFVQTFDTAVAVSKEAHMVTVDIAAHVGRGLTLRSHVDNLDPYTAFDLSLHKIEKRVRRYKNRLKEHHSKHEVQHETKALQYILSHDYGVRDPKNETVDSTKGEQSAVIAEIDGNIPTLTVSDAVMHMDLSDEPVLVFRNVAHGEINVVHRRQDGNIGWVDPEGTKNMRKIV